MAYVRPKEQIEYGLIKKNERGEYYKITRVIPEGNKLESVDFRLMYTDDNGEIKPTKKGVRVNSEDIVEFMKAAISALSTEERMELMETIEEQ